MELLSMSWFDFWRKGHRRA